MSAGLAAAISIGLLIAAPSLARLDSQAGVLDLPTAGGPGWWLAAAVMLVQAGIIAMLPRFPRSGLPAAIGMSGLLGVLGSSDLLGLTVPAIMIAAVRAVAAPRAVRASAVLLPALVLTAVVYLLTGAVQGFGFDLPLVLLSLAQATLIILAPGLIALLIRSRRETRRALEAETRALEAERSALLRERDARVQAALARERTALARELHDIAAHHLSGISLMAAAIERQVGTDPVQAGANAREVRAQSRAVLEDLRRLVGLLREGDEAELTVQTLAGVADLVAGSGAELIVHRAPEAELGHGLGPIAQLTAYRAIQEGLTNAARHAPGADCEVELDDRDPDHLSLAVRNGPAPVRGADDHGGFGLRGMAERAELIGAELSYGPGLDGGWEILLRLPRDADHQREADPTHDEPATDHSSPDHPQESSP